MSNQGRGSMAGLWWFILLVGGGVVCGYLAHLALYPGGGLRGFLVFTASWTAGVAAVWLASRRKSAAEK